jgi:hypothetical protein
VHRIIGVEVNVGWVQPVHSRRTKPEHDAFPLTSSVDVSRRRILRILLFLGLLVGPSSSAAVADDTADTLLQRGLYFSDLYNWRAARPYLTMGKIILAVKDSSVAVIL